MATRFAHGLRRLSRKIQAIAIIPCFFMAGAGLGKTHLLHAIGNGVAQEGYSVRYVSSEKFTNDLIEAIRTKSVGFAKAYAKSMSFT